MRGFGSPFRASSSVRPPRAAWFGTQEAFPTWCANAILARPDSDSRGQELFKPNFSNVFGTPEFVKGKAVLCPKKVGPSSTGQAAFPFGLSEQGELLPMASGRWKRFFLFRLRGIGGLTRLGVRRFCHGMAAVRKMDAGWFSPHMARTAIRAIQVKACQKIRAEWLRYPAKGGGIAGGESRF